MLADQADHVLGIDTHRDSQARRSSPQTRQSCKDRSQ